VSKHQPTTDIDPEIAAISVVNEALKGLEPTSQQRVLDYVAGKLGLRQDDGSLATMHGSGVDRSQDAPAPSRAANTGATEPGPDDLEGISPVAIKWMRRNGLTADSLATIFSLGVAEIDLVAKTVPGKNKKERMHSVFLLKGVASYLGSGVARMSHDQIKEACLHYDAFDTTNFASYLKSFAAEVSGSKETGYTLTARGITVATETVKSMLEPKK
jgi:hypothetical protein